MGEGWGRDRGRERDWLTEEDLQKLDGVAPLTTYQIWSIKHGVSQRLSSNFATDPPPLCNYYYCFVFYHKEVTHDTCHLTSDT